MKNIDKENPMSGCLVLMAIWIPVAIVGSIIYEKFNIDIGAVGIWILFIIIGSLVGVILFIIDKLKSR